jgi:putative transposase
MKATRYTEEKIIGVLKEAEAENTKLKRLLADVELDKAALKDLLGRKW